MTLYYCSTPPVCPHPPPTLIIDAPSIEAARAYAARKLGGEGLVVQETGEDARADVRIGEVRQ